MHFSNLSSEERFGSMDPPFTNLSISLVRGLNGLTGPNGGGKSTLLAILKARLDEAFYMPQFPASQSSVSQGQWQQGQWKRLMDAATPELLLLDEPLRHLDEEWRLKCLEFLQGYRGTTLCVCHDAELLGMARQIAHLQDGKLTLYGGDYDLYIENRRNEENARQAQVQNERVRLKTRASAAKRTLQRQRKRTDNAKRRSSTQNIPKALLHRQIHRSELTEARLKKNHDARIRKTDESLEYSKQKLQEMERGYFPVPNIESGKAEAKRIQFSSFNVARSSIGDRMPLILTGDSIKDDQGLWTNDVAINMQWGETIWIRGSNGVGKSTLLQSLLNPALQSRGLNARFYLTSLESMEVDEPLLDWLLHYEGARWSGTESDYAAKLRTLLGACGIRGESVHRSCSSFSGGERLRALLCLAAVVKPQLLLLDEPEQNLDIPARELLIECIQRYEGAVILASHDQEFVGQLMPDQIWRLDESGLRGDG